MTADELNISQHAYNCLKRANLGTVEEIASVTISDLLRIRNMGVRQAKEVAIAMLEAGFPLEPGEDERAKRIARSAINAPQRRNNDDDGKISVRGAEDEWAELLSEAESEAADEKGPAWEPDDE